jgi:hypothetical protein
MRYWFDCEFIEDGRTIDLISIGVVAEDGREFYAQNGDCQLVHASDWVRANVVPHLRGLTVPEDGSLLFADYDPAEWLDYADIGPTLRAFVGDDTPEWWGSCSAYDHVALCQLFGRMIDLPKGWPFYTNDIQQWAHQLGLPRDWDEKLPTVGTAHDALNDACWTRSAWQHLNAIAAPSH